MPDDKTLLTFDADGSKAVSEIERLRAIAERNFQQIQEYASQGMQVNVGGAGSGTIDEMLAGGPRARAAGQTAGQEYIKGFSSGSGSAVSGGYANIDAMLAGRSGTEETLKAADATAKLGTQIEQTTAHKEQWFRLLRRFIPSLGEFGETASKAGMLLGPLGVALAVGAAGFKFLGSEVDKVSEQLQKFQERMERIRSGGIASENSVIPQLAARGITGEDALAKTTGTAKALTEKGFSPEIAARAAAAAYGRNVSDQQLSELAAGLQTGELEISGNNPRQLDRSINAAFRKIEANDRGSGSLSRAAAMFETQSRRQAQRASEQASPTDVAEILKSQGYSEEDAARIARDLPEVRNRTGEDLIDNGFNDQGFWGGMWDRVSTYGRQFANKVGIPGGESDRMQRIREAEEAGQTVDQINYRRRGTGVSSVPSDFGEGGTSSSGGSFNGEVVTLLRTIAEHTSATANHTGEVARKPPVVVSQAELGYRPVRPSPKPRIQQP